MPILKANKTKYSDDGFGRVCRNTSPKVQCKNSQAKGLNPDETLESRSMEYNAPTKQPAHRPRGIFQVTQQRRKNGNELDYCFCVSVFLNLINF